MERLDLEGTNNKGGHMSRMNQASRDRLYQALCEGKTLEAILEEFKITPAQFNTAYARLGAEKSYIPPIKRQSSYKVGSKGLLIPLDFFKQNGLEEEFCQGAQVELRVHEGEICIQVLTTESRDEATQTLPDSAALIQNA